MTNVKLFPAIFCLFNLLELFCSFFCFKFYNTNQWKSKIQRKIFVWFSMCKQWVCMRRFYWTSWRFEESLVKSFRLQNFLGSHYRQMSALLGNMRIPYSASLHPLTAISVYWRIISARGILATFSKFLKGCSVEGDVYLAHECHILLILPVTCFKSFALAELLT